MEVDGVSLNVFIENFFELSNNFLIEDAIISSPAAFTKILYISQQHTQYPTLDKHLFAVYNPYISILLVEYPAISSADRIQHLILTAPDGAPYLSAKEDTF